MTLAILTDCRIWLDRYDVSGASNQITIEADRQVKECTNFNSGRNVENLLGLASAQFKGNGWYDASTSDACADALVGTNNNPMTFATNDDAASICYLARGNYKKVTRGLQVGEVAKLDFEAVTRGAEALIRGQLLLPQTTTASGSSSAAQLIGAVSATQYGYAALHVFTAGTTLAVKVQSSADGSTSWTDRITFSSTSSLGSEFLSVAGAVTHTYWRTIWTIAAGTPSFGVSFGIQ